MCLSTGTTPMPVALANAVCGPQVNFTEQPAEMTRLGSLNPCSLNACCNIWGPCGTTAEVALQQGRKVVLLVQRQGVLIAAYRIVPPTSSTMLKPDHYQPSVECKHSIVGAIITTINMSSEATSKLEIRTDHVSIWWLAISTQTPIPTSASPSVIDQNTCQVDVSYIQHQFTAFVQMRGSKRFLSLGG